MPRYNHHEGFFPGPTVNQNRRPNSNSGNYRKDSAKTSNKPNQRYNSYGSNAPKQSMNKIGPKHYQNSYDTTPIKESNGRSHYESTNSSNNNNNHAGNGNNSVRQDAVYTTPDVSNTMPPPPPTHSSYLSPYMSYVPYDGNVEHPPMYVPMNMFPSPGIHELEHEHMEISNSERPQIHFFFFFELGFSQMPLPPQPTHGPVTVASPCDPDSAESFNNNHSPAPGYNGLTFGFVSNNWTQPPLPALTHLVPQPQSSLNSSNISSTSSNANSGNASNPSQ